MGKNHRLYLLFVILLFNSLMAYAQEPVERKIPQLRPVTEIPSMPDSLSNNAQKEQKPSQQVQSIDAEITYTASDSLDFSITGKKVYMYGDAQVDYKDIELKADYIELNLDSSEVYAVGLPDSTGTIQGKPNFKQGSEEFQADKIRYNFKTKKGIVFGVTTEQQGGYVQAERTKLVNDSTYCLKNGKYTTCDAEHPHFYLEMTKAKVISNKKIITGPAYLVVEDLPLYFAIIPFGFFPNSPKYSSGFLIPSYGEEKNRGFFLRDFGYYWAASDYFDVALRGDIYSKGSRGLKFHTNYKLRYKFSGSFDMKYYKNVFGDKGLPGYYTQNDFAMTWSHRMDPKASPNQTFSASVNFSTSSYDQNNSYSTQNYLTNTKQSSISYTKRWENSPFSMSVNLRHSQNSRDTTINLTLPQMTVNMNRIYPFKSKQSIGKQKWYEKIGITYTADIQNKTKSGMKEYDLLNSSFVSDWENGVKQTIPVSTSFKALKFLTISPSFNYTERWYTKQIRKDYNYDTNQLQVTDTIYGFTRDYDYSFSVGASTKLYGMYVPRNPNSKIKGIRHVMTPSISFSTRPDFSDPRYGMYGTVAVYDSLGRPEYIRYPYHQNALYGTAGQGRSGSIGFSLNNTLEMKKLKSEKDTTSKDAYKKIKLLDQLSLSGSYNLAADSLNLSNISLRGRTKVGGTNINFGAIFDPYAMVDGRRINTFEVNQTGKLARLTSANLSFGLSFKSKKNDDKNGKTPGEEAVDDGQGKLLPGEYPEYEDFNLPWDVRLDYSFRYSKPRPDLSANITSTVDFSGNVNLTKKWKIGFSSGYDIGNSQVTFTQFNVFRDLHCWQMSLNLIPFGYRQSYSFTIRATSALLKDLKLDKRQSFYDNN
ncbi:putative LPS assembly protein LptD [Prolixibacter sp. SD074]|uniref:putative LPS assembly protein LptD n=1 Tax=Prolixibacter sp. SD074 TaxID=2652391 RepID=UPI00188DD101|nr:putative LPS assembly protein LptD [Prolixibacter sp. SD074]